MTTTHLSPSSIDARLPQTGEECVRGGGPSFWPRIQSRVRHNQRREDRGSSSSSRCRCRCSSNSSTSTTTTTTTGSSSTSNRQRGGWSSCWVASDSIRAKSQSGSRCSRSFDVAWKQMTLGALNRYWNIGIIYSIIIEESSTKNRRFHLRSLHTTPSSPVLL